MRCRSTRSRQKGAVTVLIAVCFITLLAMMALVVDVGRMYIARQTAQRLVDQCMLSGLTSFSPLVSVGEFKESFRDNAEAVAQCWNDENPIWRVTPTDSGDNLTILFESNSEQLIRLPDENPDLPANDSDGFFLAPIVSCKTHVEFTFAKILGLSGEDVNVSAKGIFAMARMMTYPFAPWAVRYDTLWRHGDGAMIHNIQYRLPLTQGTLPELNQMACVKIDPADGLSEYSDRITGEAEPVKLSTFLYRTQDPSLLQPHTGFSNLAGDTAAAIDLRIQGAKSWQEWVSTGVDDGSFEDNKRIVIIPITATETEEEVMGFAPFFIESYAIENGSLEITGRFITATITGRKIRWSLKGLTDSVARSLVGRIWLDWKYNN